MGHCNVARLGSYSTMATVLLYAGLIYSIWLFNRLFYELPTLYSSANFIAAKYNKKDRAIIFKAFLLSEALLFLFYVCLYFNYEHLFLVVFVNTYHCIYITWTNQQRYMRLCTIQFLSIKEHTIFIKLNYYAQNIVLKWFSDKFYCFLKML